MYRVRTLESLGGSNNRANSLNDLGIVSGYSDLPTGQRRASAWWLGQRMTIEPLGGTHNTIAWPVKNNIGLIVGVTQTDELQPSRSAVELPDLLPRGRQHPVPVCWLRLGTRAWCDPLPTLGGDNSFATGANNWRQVVGWAENRRRGRVPAENVQDLQFRAVRWDLNRDRTHELRPFGDRFVERRHRHQRSRPGRRHLWRLRSGGRSLHGPTRGNLGAGPARGGSTISGAGPGTPRPRSISAAT